MREWVESIAQVVLAVAAWRALSTWRLQLRGRDEYEIARSLRRSVGRLRREIRSARSPFFSAAELAQAAMSNGISDPDQIAKEGTDLQDRAVALRMHRIHDLSAEFEDAAVDAEVYWDDEAVDVLKPMRRVILDVLGQFEEYRGMLPLRSSSDPERRKEERQIWKETFRTNPTNKPDRLDQELEAAVRTIAKFLKPKLGRSRLW